MPRNTSRGECSICDRPFGKASMLRHLTACGLPAAEDAARAVPAFHLLVEHRWMKVYWLHLAARYDSRLNDLDGFLRNIWLECCDHLSSFNVGETSYTQPGDLDDHRQQTMNVRLDKVLTVGQSIPYEYDFGSTTELVIRVVGTRPVTPGGEKVQLLARNDPPDWFCEQCREAPAVQVCPECWGRTPGMLCSGCSEEHDCDPDGRLPVVNSPRVGVCAYTG